MVCQAVPVKHMERKSPWIKEQSSTYLETLLDKHQIQNGKSRAERSPRRRAAEAASDGFGIGNSGGINTFKVTSDRLHFVPCLSRPNHGSMKPRPQTTALKNECGGFVGQIADFQKMTDGFIALSDEVI